MGILDKVSGTLYWLIFIFPVFAFYYFFVLQRERFFHAMLDTLMHVLIGVFFYFVFGLAMTILVGKFYSGTF